jgi:hypothetical protein
MIASCPAQFSENVGYEKSCRLYGLGSSDIPALVLWILWNMNKLN